MLLPRVRALRRHAGAGEPWRGADLADAPPCRVAAPPSGEPGASPGRAGGGGAIRHREWTSDGRRLPRRIPAPVREDGEEATDMIGPAHIPAGRSRLWRTVGVWTTAAAACRFRSASCSWRARVARGVPGQTGPGTRWRLIAQPRRTARTCVRVRGVARRRGLACATDALALRQPARRGRPDPGSGQCSPRCGLNVPDSVPGQGGRGSRVAAGGGGPGFAGLAPGAACACALRIALCPGVDPALFACGRWHPSRAGQGSRFSVRRGTGSRPDHSVPSPWS